VVVVAIVVVAIAVAIAVAAEVAVAVAAALKVETAQKVAMWFVKPNRMAPFVVYGIMYETSLFLLSLVFITTYYI
jgi:hypothetical protein